MLEFGADNRLDDALRETSVEAAGPESAVVDLVPVGVEREGDGVLKIGSLLPETGSLAFLGPPEFAGVEYAIDEINAAGGVLGAPVEYSQGDSGDTSPTRPPSPRPASSARASTPSSAPPRRA